MGIYNLDRASLASVAATVMTYLIVLLQFKVTEMGIWFQVFQTYENL